MTIVCRKTSLRGERHESSASLRVARGLRPVSKMSTDHTMGKAQDGKSRTTAHKTIFGDSFLVGKAAPSSRLIAEDRARNNNWRAVECVKIMSYWDSAELNLACTNDDKTVVHTGRAHNWAMHWFYAVLTFPCDPGYLSAWAYTLAIFKAHFHEGVMCENLPQTFSVACMIAPRRDNSQAWLVLEMRRVQIFDQDLITCILWKAILSCAEAPNRKQLM